MSLICFVKNRISCFCLTEQKDKAGCFQSKSADEEACVTVKIERSRGTWHHLLLPLYFFYFFLSLWWYFRTDHTSGWLFNGCKAFTARSLARMRRCCVCQGSRQRWEKVHFWHNESALQRSRKVARLESPSGTLGCSPASVWQPVLILLVHVLSLKHGDVPRDDLQHQKWNIFLFLWPLSQISQICSTPCLRRWKHLSHLLP